jgi:hypothetical protein
MAFDAANNVFCETFERDVCWRIAGQGRRTGPMMTKRYSVAACVDLEMRISGVNSLDADFV